MSNNNIIALSRMRFDELPVGSIFSFAPLSGTYAANMVGMSVTKHNEIVAGRPYVLAERIRHKPDRIVQENESARIMALDYFKAGGVNYMLADIFDSSLNNLAIQNLFRFYWTETQAHTNAVVTRRGSIFPAEHVSSIPHVGDPMLAHNGKRCKRLTADLVRLAGGGLHIECDRFSAWLHPSNGFSRPFNRNSPSVQRQVTP